MKKKRGKFAIQVSLSNRWLYTFIVIGILVAIGVGVYALAPGTKPNPGHSLSEISGIPTDCLKNDSLKWDGTNFICSHTTALYLDTNNNLTFSPTYTGAKLCGTCLYNANVCGSGVSGTVGGALFGTCDGSCPSCPSSCTCKGGPYVYYCSNMPAAVICTFPNTFKGFLLN
jgi:hypothetical protein